MRFQICAVLVHPLNKISAYELYADPNSDRRPASNVGTQDTVTMADRFKTAFSHNNVTVHFVGAWCVIQTMALENENDSSRH